jgi:A/G-specific adenine glycosylase
MLQQTQVSRVVPAFERFVRRFPSATDLAQASEGEVLAHWQGLGYYRRARLLHAAARHVAERHGGEVPTDVSALRELPGVGRYVAGAIASIVARAREPIVDGNVARVMLRLHGRAVAPDDPATVKWLWSRAQEWVDESRDPSAANEGLMELGATICTPRSARCGECPLAGRCAARRSGSVAEIPSPKRSARAVRKRRGRIEMSTLIAVHRGRIAMEQRPDTGLWAGLWQTPTREVVARGRVGAEAATSPGPWRGARRAGAVDAVLSHRRVRIDVWVAAPAASARLRRGPSPDWSWVPIGQLGDVPLSNAMRRVLDVAGIHAPDPARPLRASGRAGARSARGRRAGTVLTR